MQTTTADGLIFDDAQKHAPLDPRSAKAGPDSAIGSDCRNRPHPIRSRQLRYVTFSRREGCCLHPDRWVSNESGVEPLHVNAAPTLGSGGKFHRHGTSGSLSARERSPRASPFNRRRALHAHSKAHWAKALSILIRFCSQDVVRGICGLCQQPHEPGS